MITIILFLLTQFSLATVSLAPEDSKPVRQFVQKFSQKTHIPTEWLNRQFQSLHLNERVLSLIQKPYEDKIWGDYQRHLLSQRRIDGGKRFMQQNQAALNQAQQDYGVDPSVIVAILGVETSYGENMGNFNSLEALATLAFFYAPRHSFFEDEMAALLTIGYEKDWDLHTVKGSYAGALGMPQFMPSNVISYAVAGTLSAYKQISLFNHADDVISSVANYLKARGHWQKGEPIVTPLTNLSSDTIAQLDQKFGNKNIIALDSDTLSLLPTMDASKPKSPWLIRLRYADHHDFYLAHQNFKSIMSYNNSVNYAFAVTSLGASIYDQHSRLSTQ